MAAQVVAALGEDQARPVRPAVDRHEHRGVLAAVGIEPDRLGGVEEAPPQLGAQMITPTVPPSTLQAEPAT